VSVGGERQHFGHARGSHAPFLPPRRVSDAARPSLTATLVPNRATRPYLPRLSSNSAMRRQTLASKSRQMDGELDVVVAVGSGVGIISCGTQLGGLLTDCF